MNWEAEIQNPPPTLPMQLVSLEETPRQRLSIKHQPKSHFRFRYSSELTSTTHGVLQAKDAVVAAQYPSVKFVIQNQEKCCSEYFIIAWLYKAPKANESPTQLSPHLLEQKKSDVNSGFVIGTMTEIVNDGYPEYNYELKDCYIKRLLKREIPNAVRTRRSALIAVCPGLAAHIANPHDSNENKCEVHLSFAVCTKHNEIYQLVEGPVISDVIVNGVEVQISEVYNTRVPEGMDVNLQCELPTKDIILRLWVLNEDGHPIWERTIKRESIKFKPHSVICFTMPKCYEDGNKPIADEIKCFVRIVCPKLNTQSAPSQFICILNPGQPSGKRSYTNTSDEVDGKIPLYADSIGNESHDADSPIFQLLTHFENNQIAKIRKLDHEFQKSNDMQNSVFHEAISSHAFINLTDSENFDAVSALCRAALNARQENLLHHACKLNMSLYIQCLSRLGGMMCAQNCKWQTPLHVALAKEHSDCVAEFAKIFADAAANATLVGELRRLVQAADARCYTVLHLAAVQGCDELVRHTLAFCKENAIDVQAMIEPSAGNSIIHLAAAAGRISTVQAIIEMLPQAQFYENYVGDTIFDLSENISSEMKRFIDEL